ncbi:MAG: HDOD domain-containing protein [Candidatus Nitricoxidivorans perseverans]|uniref:HDOD domain-containing protein n=1 Tax=Candidatus Nitricoxidivorans perseverans TaxID=2975601 RepID=A0AA49FJT8_9PROT|nr:MAG: HDOD domain-containing protein [Candidatus Nitricoxidivorans perseverans]
MMTSRSATSFPTISLLPVEDAHHGWSALLLEMPGAFDVDALARLFGEFGLYEALDNLPCIVSLLDPAGLSREIVELLPADRVVLRIPPDVCADPARQDDLAHLRGAGFKLISDELPAVGSRSSRPVKESSDNPRQALLLRLLALIAADADSHQMETIFKQDAHLSYQLLKLVNSVAFSLSTKITSFNQAITLLGRRQIQRWLQLLLYAHAPGAAANPLMPRAALRAELMESLCAETGGGKESQDRAYMVGMFSLLDMLFGMTVAEIVAPLNLADDVASALTEHSGALGTLLRAVEAGEEGSGPRLSAALATAGIDPAAWAGALVQAYHWAIPISRET